MSFHSKETRLKSRIKIKDRSRDQLGKGMTSANHQLHRDLLFDFAIKTGHFCYRCGQPLTRDTFTIDHIVPWLDTENAKALFFSIDNIAFSHRVCNLSVTRRVKKYATFKEQEKASNLRYKTKHRERLLEYGREYRRKKAALKISDSLSC